METSGENHPSCNSPEVSTALGGATSRRCRRVMDWIIRPVFYRITCDAGFHGQGIDKLAGTIPAGLDANPPLGAKPAGNIP